MSIPAWIPGFVALLSPTSRYEALFSKSDAELAARGYDRAGLERTYIAGLGGH